MGGAVRLGSTALCPRGARGCRECGFHSAVRVGSTALALAEREGAVRLGSTALAPLLCSLVCSSPSFLLSSDLELKDTNPCLAPLSRVAPPPGLSVECVVLR